MSKALIAFVICWALGYYTGVAWLQIKKLKEGMKL
jgi:hypothetical protein